MVVGQIMDHVLARISNFDFSRFFTTFSGMHVRTVVVASFLNWWCIDTC